MSRRRRRKARWGGLLDALKSKLSFILFLHQR